MLAAAVREDSEQHTAHHGKAWHQVRVPGWATKGQQITQITQIIKSVKSVKSVDKKVENNKSTFYSKINGFLFGSFGNNHYLCISERNKYCKPLEQGGNL